MERLEFFEPDFKTREELAKLYMTHFQSTLIKYWDKLKKYIEWNSLEETINHYSFNDYNRLWDQCRRDNVVLKPKEESIDFKSIFDKFSNEQLQILFESQNMHKVVRYFKWYRENHKQFDRCLPKNDMVEDAKNGAYYQERLSISLRNRTYQNNLDEDRERTKEEIDELENAIEATNYIYFALNNPTEIPELVDLIVNHLQYMDLKNLKKLLMLIDKNFEQKPAGRPQKNWKVLQYDMKGNLVAEYNSRTECMEKNNIKKSLMSLLLSGKRKTHKGYKYVEMRVIKIDNN